MDLEKLTCKNRNQMISDDLAPSVPRKRSRSPSPHASISVASFPTGINPPSTVPTERERDPRPSKRPRTSLEPLSYDTSTLERQTAGLASQNPLNRRALKKSAKATRKADRKRAKGIGKGGGMEVDGEGSGGGGGGLEFTFMAGLDGVVG